MLLYDWSGSMQASIHIVEFIKSKYRLYFKGLNLKREEESQPQNAHKPKDSETKLSEFNNSNIQYFEIVGLKNQIKISIEVSNESKISCTVSTEEYDDDSVHKADFIGTTQKTVQKIKFLSYPPKTGDEWPNKPWKIKTVDGKEIHYVLLTTRDSETNKWSVFIPMMLTT